MKISRSQTPEGYGIIKSNTYSHSLEYLKMLVSEAKINFSDLKDSEISIKVYNDNKTGIEFLAFLHPAYEEILMVPCTFN